MAYSVPVNLVVILSFGLFVFYLAGIHNTLVNIGENGCDMTYMFEFPQFVEISLPSHVRQAHPRYGLYGYAEGVHTEKLRQMKFRGVPVLFIPGSSGSYKQGRSMASVSLRKSISSKTNFQFDYFMVDFNEDQSALYGGTLELQTKFVRHCIVKILSLYSRKERKPNSVILVGHSVGGLIAKSVLVDPKFPISHVKLIISLASPLKAPVLVLDKYIMRFYTNLIKYWEKNKDLNHTTLVSIGGGNRDLLVRSDLTHDPHGHINVLTSAIPGVWCGTDHLNIVWCKQLILTVIRALFDCVNPHTKQLLPSHEMRYDVFNYHLMKRSGGKHFSPDLHPRFVTFDEDAVWSENVLRKFSIVYKKGTKLNTYIMIRLNQDSKYPNVIIEAINININDWVFVCTADTVYEKMRICETGENLSNMTELSPTPIGSKDSRKFVYLNLPDYKINNYTHVVINIPEGDNYVRVIDFFYDTDNFEDGKNVQVNVDIHNEESRTIDYQVPGVYNMKRHMILRKTAENSLYYKINLVGFQTIWQGFFLGVETNYCKKDKNNAVISFMTPWAAQHNHFIMMNKSMVIRLALTSTRYDFANYSMYPYLRLSLDPTCNYRVMIQPSITTAASQIVIYFTEVLPAYILTVLLLTIREQILHLDEGENVFFHAALCAAVSRYYLIVQATIFGSKILGLGIFLYVLPKPDFTVLENFNLDFFLMSLIMYAVAIIITYSSGIASYVSIVLIGKVAHKMALRLIAQSITGFMHCSEWFLSFLHQVPILASALLVSLALSVSGALSMCIATMFYFMKISNMYEVYLEDMLQYSLKYFAQKVRRLKKRKRQRRYIGEQLNVLNIGNDTDEESTKANTLPMAADETESNGNESDASMGLSESDILDGGLLWNVHFHVSLFLLWALITMLNMPSLLVWARNYNFKFFMENDPSVIPSIIIHICGSLLWQPGIPHPCRRLSKSFSAILFALATITIIYGSVSLYRLNYIICFAVIILTVNQLMAKFSY